jgi:hypothetical protein
MVLWTILVVRLILVQQRRFVRALVKFLESPPPLIVAVLPRLFCILVTISAIARFQPMVRKTFFPQIGSLVYQLICRNADWPLCVSITERLETNSTPIPLRGERPQQAA